MRTSFQLFEVPPSFGDADDRNVGRAAASLRGKLGRSDVRGVHFEEADEITIEGDSSNLILDGETFRTQRGRPINLTPASPLSFVKLAA